MKPLRHTLRLAALICVAALLIATLSQGTVGLVLAFLVPVWFFFVAVVSVPIPALNEARDIRLFPSLPVFSPRPPPIS